MHFHVGAYLAPGSSAGKEVVLVRWRSMVAAACALTMAACGSSGEEATDAAPTTTRAGASSTSTTATVQTTTTTVPLTDEELVVQTVEEMWLMLKTVGAAPDPASPELEKYLTSPQLEKAQASMAEWQQKGYFVQDGPKDKWKHRPKVVSVTGDAAVVEDCATDDGWLMKRVSAEVTELVNGDEVVALWHTELIRTEGVWKISHLERRGAWYSGDPGCVPGW